MCSVPSENQYRGGGGGGVLSTVGSVKYGGGYHEYHGGYLDSNPRLVQDQYKSYAL